MPRKFCNECQKLVKDVTTITPSTVRMRTDLWIDKLVNLREGGDNEYERRAGVQEREQ